MRRNTLTRFAGLLLLSVTVIPAAADAKGWFGFAAKVDVDGFISPTLRSIKIASVVTGSPAQVHGLATGDEIIEVEGVAVAGCKARELQPLMEKKIGETLHLRVKHASGETYSADLVAAIRPK
jgi:C-terminal processing protease CtpA/Prc